MRAEHDLRGHADHDAHGRVLRAQALHGEQGRQEVRVAGGAGGVEVDAVGAGLAELAGDVDHVLDGELHGLLLRGARLVDAHRRQQLRPVAARPVGVRVAAEVGLGAVVHGDGDPLLRLLHRLLLGADDGLDRLVRVVDVVELAGVGAEALLVLHQRVDAAALLRRAAAVEAEDDLVPDVDGGEARAAGEDVQEVIELVRAQLGRARPGGGRARALLELALELAARQRDGGAVPLTRHDPRFHAAPCLSGGARSPPRRVLPWSGCYARPGQRRNGRYLGKRRAGRPTYPPRAARRAALTPGRPRRYRRSRFG